MIKKLLACMLAVSFILVAPLEAGSKTEEVEVDKISFEWENPHPVSCPPIIIPPDLLKAPYSENISVLVTKEVREKISNQIANMEEEIIMLAKVCKREAGGIAEISHQAAPIWCVLNRVDRGFDDSIKKVITRPGAFAWYSNTKINDHFLWLAEDVLTRWLLEKEGFEDVGRVLPADYCFFNGKNGYNHYRKEYRSKERWDWSLPTPYES